MKLPDPAAAPARLANRVLEQESWAREKLAPFAGRTFTLAVGPARARFRVAADGLLEAAEAGATPDLALALAPLSVPSFLADPARWNEFVREDGDAELGGALKELARTIPWFVEAAFSRVLGPMLGTQAADAGRRLLAFPGFASQRLGESVGSYVREESRMVAQPAAMRRFADDVADTAARVDALEQRFAALSARVAAGKPQPLAD